MCASACFMLGFMHLLFLLNYKKSIVHLLLSLMAFSAGSSALLELGLLSTQSLEIYRALIRWENLAIFMILIPMVWFVQVYFNTARCWLALSITFLWSIAILVNFYSPHSLTFDNISELKRLPAFGGDMFTLPLGAENPWKVLADISSLLIIIYVADATIRSWLTSKQKEALIIGGGILTFIIAAGIHTPLVDAGIMQMPYMISFAFLAIVITMSYLLVAEAIHAGRYAQELQQTRHSLDLLARSNMLGEYATMFAHELNQPLTAILSNAQAAKRYMASDTSSHEEMSAILDDIVRDDKRAGEIIKRLRNLLRKEEVIRERFDIVAAISEVVEILNNEFKEKNIDLSEKYSLSPILVYAGRVELQQVMLNLIINAVHALDDSDNKNRKLGISAGVLDGLVKVEVADSGSGISNEVYDSLFDSIMTNRNDGMGMGLAISRRIIETYGGRIWARNAEAGGAVFSFTLPVDK